MEPKEHFEPLPKPSFDEIIHAPLEQVPSLALRLNQDDIRVYNKELLEEINLLKAGGEGNKAIEVTLANPNEVHKIEPMIPSAETQANVRKLMQIAGILSRAKNEALGKGSA